MIPTVAVFPSKLVAIRAEVAYFSIDDSVLSAIDIEQRHANGNATAIIIKIAFASDDFAAFIFSAKAVIVTITETVLKNGSDGVHNIWRRAFRHCWKWELRVVHLAVLHPDLNSISCCEKIVGRIGAPVFKREARVHQIRARL